MNRAFFAVVLGVVSFAMVGCAAGVDDPVAPPPEPVEVRNPPAQTFNGDLQNPIGMNLGAIEENRGYENVPARQRPRLPQPSGTEPVEQLDQLDTR